MNSVKRGEYRSKMIDCTTEALFKSKRFNDKKVDLMSIVMMEIAKCEEGPFGLLYEKFRQICFTSRG